MNGLEFAQYLKDNQFTEAISIIFITASSLQEDQEIIQSLSNGFIRKPITISQLVLQLKNILPSNDENTVIFKSSPEIFKRFPELCDRLDTEVAEYWPELCITQKQRDLKYFVKRLQGWAKEYQCQILWEYAETLNTQLEEFDWGNLPNTLESFPELIMQISNQLGK